MKEIFEDIKVVELATVLAGPHVGMFFAELGAQVVKIEHPAKGDVTRSWKLKNEDERNKTSAYFSSVNYKKNYIDADLSSVGGKEILFRELEDADILIVNFKKGSAEKLGLSIKFLREKFPSLIIGHITGYGKDDSKTAYDLILQAETGFMSMNGTANSGPLKMPVALIDVLAAHQMKEALLIALMKRSISGKSHYVEVSLYDTAVSSLVNQATNWLMAGKTPERMGSLHPNIAPYGEIFITTDQRMVTFAVGNDKQFKELCNLLGIFDIPSDSMFANNQERLKHRKELYILLNEKICKWNSKELLKLCLSLGIPAGKINDLKQVFENDKAKRLVKEEAICGEYTKRVSSFIANFSD